MVASSPDVESTSRLGLLRRSPSFGYLFLATAGSSFGTYLAAIALVLQIRDLTGSGVWVAALLIADFLPIVVIGFLLGPLVDRLSRRGLMIASDLVRFGVFAALPFVGSPEGLVVLAGVTGVATGFFFPAANAAIPNLVPEEELANANSLTVTIDTLAMTLGPLLGALLYTAWGPSVPYAFNAVTFLVSAAFVARIRETSLRSEDPLTRGHWRDVADGLKLVATSRPLRTVLIVWNVALLGAGAVNVAEVFYAKDVLDAGDLGYGALVAASGVGLAIGSFLSAPALGKVGLRRNYVGSLVLMGVGWGAAALSGSIWLAVAFVIGGAAGNGSVVVCNRLLVQRGAPDQYRGRALATIMSSNYAVVGLAMAAAGVLTDVVGPRAVWIGAGVLYLCAAAVALVMTRWLPVTQADEWDAVEASSESAAAALGNGHAKPVDAEAGGERRARAAARAHRDAPRGDRGAPGGRSATSFRTLNRVSAVGRKELTLEELVAGVRAADRRALARAISLVEDGDPLAYPLVRELYPSTGGAAIVGVTGPPGVGKSSLIGALVGLVRESERTVGVVSVDPSSPFSHGALLGDRIRLSDHFLDPGVYIRSMGTRGHLGGLAEATLQAVLILDAAGKDVVFVETVGAGQSEVEVTGIADTVLLVLMPGSGDSVQALKAGIMEIPDVIAINKMDHPAAKTMLNEVRSIVGLAEPETRPTILLTEALTGENVSELWAAVEQHRAALESDGRLEERRRKNLSAEVFAVASSRAKAHLQAAVAEDPELQRVLGRVEARELDPLSAVREIMEEVFRLDGADDR